MFWQLFTNWQSRNSTRPPSEVPSRASDIWTQLFFSLTLEKWIDSCNDWSELQTNLFWNVRTELINDESKAKTDESGVWWSWQWPFSGVTWSSLVQNEIMSPSVPPYSSLTLCSVPWIKTTSSSRCGRGSKSPCTQHTYQQVNNSHVQSCPGRPLYFL